MNSLKTRTLSFFLVLLALIAVMGTYGMYKINQVAKGLETVNDVNSLKLRYAINFRGSVHDRSILVRDAVLSTSPADMAQSVTEIGALARFYDESAGPLDEMFRDASPDQPAETEILRRIKAVEERTLPMVDAIVTAAQAGDLETAEAIVMNDARPAFVDWLAVINEFIDFQEALNQSVGASVDSAVADYQTYKGLMIALAIAVSGLGIWSTIRAFRPLTSVTAAIERVADGDLKVDPGSKGLGDVGELQRAACTMIQTISQSNKERERLAAAELAAREEQAAAERHRLEEFAAKAERLRREGEDAARTEAEARTRGSRMLEKELARVIGGAREGDLSTQVAGTFDDPALSEVQSSVNQLIETMETALSGTMQFLSALSHGKLHARIDGTFDGDFQKLQSDANNAASSLEGTVSQIADQARNVSNNSRDIDAAARDVAGRTEQNAQTLAQTVAALTDLTVSVGQTADSAREASRAVASAMTEAQSSEEVMRATMTAMQEIEDYSTRISSATQVINDIAFQTNLLALNAGVEAARAGESGRGFAVVATEVRSLAQRASEAASEIGHLIESSTTQVKTGVDLVSKTGEGIRSMVEYVNVISRQMNEISSSANMQASQLGEVNQSAQSIDGEMKMSAKQLEATTGAVTSLRGIAEQLSEMLAHFQTRDTANAAAAPAMAGRAAA